MAASLAPAAPTEVVAVKGLSKRYGDFIAVDDVSLSLQAGTITGFLGPNGAGKTVTLKLLLGLAAPSSGEALIFGRRYRDLDEPLRKVGAVLESGGFEQGRSGRDHLRVLALAAGLPPSRVDEVLALVALTSAARRAVQTYSLGMRQRLCLAAALLGDPRLLVLDEPSNGLDLAGLNWLHSFLGAYVKRGGTVLVTSHVLTDIAETVDRIIVMNEGRVVASGPLEEFRSGGRSLQEAYLDLTGEPRS